VRLIELPAEERPQVIAEYLHRGVERSGSKSAAKQARYYFGMNPDPSPEEIREVAGYYPVFRVAYGQGLAGPVFRARMPRHRPQGAVSSRIRPANDRGTSRNDGNGRATECAARGHIRASSQVLEATTGTLSRWRHGFKSRWDYEGNPQVTRRIPDSDRPSSKETEAVRSRQIPHEVGGPPHSRSQPAKVAFPGHSQGGDTGSNPVGTTRKRSGQNHCPAPESRVAPFSSRICPAADRPTSPMRSAPCIPMQSSTRPPRSRACPTSSTSTAPSRSQTAYARKASTPCSLQPKRVGFAVLLHRASRAGLTPVRAARSRRRKIRSTPSRSRRCARHSRLFATWSVSSSRRAGSRFVMAPSTAPLMMPSSRSSGSGAFRSSATGRDLVVRSPRGRGRGDRPRARAGSRRRLQHRRRRACASSRVAPHPRQSDRGEAATACPALASAPRGRRRQRRDHDRDPRRLEREGEA
jgi:hypothetical protein